MPIEKETGFKNAAARRIIERQCKRLHLECHAIQFDCERQDQGWKNQVAEDLMHLLGRAMYFLETDRDESDVAAARATLRIVRRVEEFEGIRRVQ